VEYKPFIKEHLINLRGHLSSSPFIVNFLLFNHFKAFCIMFHRTLFVFLFILFILHSALTRFCLYAYWLTWGIVGLTPFLSSFNLSTSVFFCTLIYNKLTFVQSFQSFLYNVSSNFVCLFIHSLCPNCVLYLTAYDSTI
jgi:hypothetical protein